MFPETKWRRLHPDEISAMPREAPKGTPQGESEVRKAGDLVTETSPLDPWLGRGSPNRQQWGVYTPSKDPLKAILMDIWIPWKLFAFPIVELGSFIVSWSCSSFLTINLTQSQNFASAPYNYNSQTIGFMNFAILAGALIGLATAGPLSDWVSARATGKNRGIREPEMRLPAMSRFLDWYTSMAIGFMQADSIRSPLCTHHDSWELHW